MMQTHGFAAILSLGLAIASLAGCEGDSTETPAGPLRVLITNDDGVGAEGIDVVVEALRDDPNYEIIVSAPLEDSSGSGDDTIEDDPTCGTGEATRSSTASGYTETTWAVDGCPADAVNYALETLYPETPPHVVLSGINEGQNVGNVGAGGSLSQISGTVGAAKTAACANVPALASSQGFGTTINYGAGLAEVLTWLNENRAALLRGEVPVESITSINIPSCDTGSNIRGRLPVPLGTMIPDYLTTLGGPQDCESTRDDLTDDIQAFFNGYVATSPVPRNTTCPDE